MVLWGPCSLGIYLVSVLWQRPSTQGHQIRHSLQVAAACRLLPSENLHRNRALRKPNPPQVLEGGSATAAPSQSLQCPTTPGCKSTRSHREQQRIALTKQVAPPDRNSWPAWQHKTTAEATRTGDPAQPRILRNRNECSSVLACNSLAMKCACSLVGLWARSGRLSTPLHWGLRLLLPQRCLHNRVGIGHQTFCGPGSPAQQQVRAPASEGRLVLSLPLEEWCGRPPYRPPRCTEKVARGIGPQKEGVCLLPPCCADLRASPLSTPHQTPQSRRLSILEWSGGPLHRCSNSICWATALDTALLYVSPTTMPLTPPVGLTSLSPPSPSPTDPPPLDPLSRTLLRKTPLRRTALRRPPKLHKMVLEKPEKRTKFGVGVHNPLAPTLRPPPSPRRPPSPGRHPPARHPLETPRTQPRDPADTRGGEGANWGAERGGFKGEGFGMRCKGRGGVGGGRGSKGGFKVAKWF